MSTTRWPARDELMGMGGFQELGVSPAHQGFLAVVMRPEAQIYISQAY